MKTAVARLRGISPYSQSRFHNSPKLDKESPDDYENRTWMERCNCTKDGHIYIPPMALKNCVESVAQFLSIKVTGKGNATWTKHFRSGIMTSDPVVLPDRKEGIEGEWFFVPSDGKRGGGKRVMKCFPVIREWEGDAIFYIIDETITEKVFLHHLSEAGKFIGIGRFRPQSGGFYGRFEVVGLDWS